MLSNFLIIPVVKDKIKVTNALFIPLGAPITVVKEIVDLQRLVADKTIKVLSMQSHAAACFLNFLLFNFFFYFLFKIVFSRTDLIESKFCLIG